MAKQCMIFIAYHIKKNSGKPNNMLLVVHHVLPFPICRVRSLLRAPTPRGVTSQLLKKTMIIIDGQLYQRKENKDENEACASLLGAFL